MIGWNKKKIGKIFLVSEQFISNLPQKKALQANGIIIFQAVDCPRSSFLIMQKWNGQLNPCWLLDVHFKEDWCRMENKAVQQSLNMFRKSAVNLVKQFKTRNNSKQPISHIMFQCMLDSNIISRVVVEN